MKVNVAWKYIFILYIRGMIEMEPIFFSLPQLVFANCPVTSCSSREQGKIYTIHCYALLHYVTNCYSAKCQRSVSASKKYKKVS